MKLGLFIIILILSLFSSTHSFTASMNVSMSDNVELLNVILPSTVKFTIDPFEVDGKGQIYSDVYLIENIGETEITLTFTKIYIIFSNGTDFETLSKPFDENIVSSLKSIYLLLDFGRDEIMPIVLSDNVYSEEVTIVLGPAMTDTAVLPISFSGSVNHLPANEWNAGDINIYLEYTLAYVDQFMDEDADIEYVESKDCFTESDSDGQVNETYDSIDEAEENSEVSNDAYIQNDIDLPECEDLPEDTSFEENVELQEDEDLQEDTGFKEDAELKADEDLQEDTGFKEGAELLADEDLQEDTGFIEDVELQEDEALQRDTNLQNNKDLLEENEGNDNG